MALQNVPIIVAGIEHIHGEASGATKKQMAMDALGLASYTAQAVLPEHSAAAQAATALASQTIDGVVAVMNAAKEKPAAAAVSGAAQ